MRLRNLVLFLVTVVGVVVISACGSSGGDEQGNQQSPQQEPPRTMSEEAEGQQVAPRQGTTADSGETANAVEPPEDKTLKLTIPAMERIEDDEIPTGLGNQEELFRDYAAVHLKYTGWPWEEEANVYIAGHRLGYEDTASHLAFYDLEDLKNGDEVYITDANGTQYTYEVYETVVVEPTNLSVLAPIEGKNIVSLQTCTLPDYTDRVIVRAELKDIKQA